MENELVFGILTRDGVLLLALGMFVFTAIMIIYAMIIAPILSLSRDKKSKIAKSPNSLKSSKLNKLESRC